jgi:hypothetical protein
MRAVEIDATSICIQGIALCRVPAVYFVRLGSLLCVEGAAGLAVRIR